MDGIIASEFDREERERYENMVFVLRLGQEEVEVRKGFTISNIEFERTDL